MLRPSRQDVSSQVFPSQACIFPSPTPRQRQNAAAYDTAAGALLAEMDVMSAVLSRMYTALNDNEALRVALAKNDPPARENATRKTNLNHARPLLPPSPTIGLKQQRTSCRFEERVLRHT